MPKLNLETKTREQELVKRYLEENASEILAEKINHGTFREINGKTFLNKKTLNGFMKFASEEARKLASKGATSACVEDSVVYGWAVHYFEEADIIGTLYNEDGTEYKPPMPEKKPVAAKPQTTTPLPATKPQKPPQLSLFDLLAKPQTASPAVTEKPEPDDEEIPNENEIADSEKTWLDENTYADTDGVIHDRSEPITTEENTNEPNEESDIDTSAFNTEALCKLYDDFGDEIEVR